jgi:hypothetical protein
MLINEALAQSCSRFSYVELLTDENVKLNIDTNCTGIAHAVLGKYEWEDVIYNGI